MRGEPPAPCRGRSQNDVAAGVADGPLLRRFSQEGYDADFAVFDLHTVGARSTFDWLRRTPVGVDPLLVNGATTGEPPEQAPLINDDGPCGAVW